jgi:hypothetical protein
LKENWCVVCFLSHQWCDFHYRFKSSDVTIVFKMILFQFIFLQDLIPPSYLDELSLLQDRISPFSTEVAFNTIEQELGLPIDELFSEISPEPIAAASLGQVYICLCS